MRNEVNALLSQLQDTSRLVAELLYGPDMRLMACDRLPVLDFDFNYYQILVREAKGGQDRVAPLPRTLIDRLRAHLGEVKKTFDADQAAGYREVDLPDVLTRKYPNAAAEWRWW